MARVLVTDDFAENISYYTLETRVLINRNIQVMTDILELVEASDEHTFTVYNFVLRKNYPILMIKYESDIFEEILLDEDDVRENIKRMSDQAYKRPDLEYLQKYRRTQLEIDMGM